MRLAAGAAKDPPTLASKGGYGNLNDPSSSSSGSTMKLPKRLCLRINMEFIMYIIIVDFKLFAHIVLEVLGALVSTNNGGRNSDSIGGVNCIQYGVTNIIMVATFARTGENNVLGKIPWLLQFQREVNGKGDRD
jgi:hypothetical protein